MTKTELLRRWYDEVWENGNLDVIDDFFDPETVAAGIVPEMQMGRDDFKALVMAFQSHVGTFKIDLLKVIESGDWLAAIIRVSTTRSDNGAPIEVTGQTMTRFKGDKMVEAYNQMDYITLLEQLELLPADTLPICMTGQRLDWT